VLPKVKLQEGDNHRERVVSPDEEELYLKAAGPLLRDRAFILFDCGLRPEEAHSLKWPYIRNGNVENYEGKTPRARRSVPATARVMEMLERRFASADGEWIFPAPTKSGHIGYDSVKSSTRPRLRYVHMANPKAQAMQADQEVQGGHKTGHRDSFTLLMGGAKTASK
jgi:integrase